MKAKLLFIGTIVLSASMSACLWDDCGGGTPPGGFEVRTADAWIPDCPKSQNPAACVTSTIFPIRIPHPGVYVSGNQVCDLGAPGCVGGIYEASYGTVYHFGEPSAGDLPAITSGAPNQTSSQWANYTVQNGRVNALWNSSVADWSASTFYGAQPCQNTSANAQFQVTLYNCSVDILGTRVDF